MEKTANNFRRKSKKYENINNFNNNNYIINTEINDRMSKTQYNDKGNKRGFSYKKGKMNNIGINYKYNYDNSNDNYNPILNTETNAYANVITRKNIFNENKKRNNTINKKNSKKVLPNIIK